MLTDIFANRYAKVSLWSSFGEPQRRLIVQAFRVLEEHVCPYWVDGKETPHSKAFWTEIQGRLSMELGLKSLSPVAYSYQGRSGIWTMNYVCEQWMLKTFDNSATADHFIKERLSLVEIGFRKRAEEIEQANKNLPSALEAAEKSQLGALASSLRIPGDYVGGIKALNAKLNSNFQAAVDELNVRFRQADCNLNYHNGFIQISIDPLVAENIETPFWAVVADSKWNNVDVDMKEAIDRRDTGGRDPAFYAVRALESAIKIISDERNLTHNRERGAHNYIDNLSSNKFIQTWEAEQMKGLFTNIRNPLGHGPGSEALIQLSPLQTDWIIEACMAWIKSMARRP
jgi:hypothetical protein